MQMLYNSDSFVVVQFEVPGQPATDATPTVNRGGYEIVDKFARKEIYIEGALAEAFKQGVQALVEQGPGGEAGGATMEEAMDEFIGRFTTLAQQPVVLH